MCCVDRLTPQPEAATHAPDLDFSEADNRGSPCGNTTESLRSRSCPHERGIEHLDERRTIVGVRLTLIELNELLDLGLDRDLSIHAIIHHVRLGSDVRPRCS